MIDVLDRLKECKTLVKLVALGDATAAVDLCQRVDAAAAEIESLRREWAEGVSKAIGQLKENRDIIKDATERLDRAGF